MSIETTAMDDRSRQRYGEADGELAGWFSASVGVRAQSYEPASGTFRSDVAHEGRVAALERGTMAWFDRVAGAIGALTPPDRRIVALVYHPHSWPTWLASALSTSWGGGNFVALASTLQRALAAAGSTDPAATLSWFHRQGRGGAEKLFKQLKTDCEAIRKETLAAYEPLRKESIREAARAQAEREKIRKNQRAKAIAEEVGKRPAPAPRRVRAIKPALVWSDEQRALATAHLVRTGVLEFAE